MQLITVKFKIIIKFINCVDIISNKWILFQIPSKGRIFGVPLAELTEKCDNSANVPNIVFQLVAFIRRHGFQGMLYFRVFCAEIAVISTTLCYMAPTKMLACR